jgi:hypothetical protein
MGICDDSDLALIFNTEHQVEERFENLGPEIAKQAISLWRWARSQLDDGFPSAEKLEHLLHRAKRIAPVMSIEAALGPIPKRKAHDSRCALGHQTNMGSRLSYGCASHEAH